MKRTPPYATEVTPRLKEETRFRSCRVSILILFIFTIVNIILILSDSGIYFLFTAMFPYWITTLPFYITEQPGILVCAVFALIGAVLTVPYLLAFLFSNKHPGWFIFSAIYFAIDCLILIFFFVTDMMADGMEEYLLDLLRSYLFDILFHVYVMVELLLGIKSASKLKKLDAEAAEAEAAQPKPGDDYAPEAAVVDEGESNIPLRVAGNEEESKVYVTADYNGHNIVYRKYGKGLEELVVDGNVYAEFRFTGIARPHEMSATVNGRKIAVGFYQINYIIVDGTRIAQSTRWI